MGFRLRYVKNQADVSEIQVDEPSSIKHIESNSE